MSLKLAEIVYNDLNEPNFEFKDFEDIFIGNKSFKNGDIFSLISNKINGLDMDWFDYLRRDTFYGGIRSNINWNTIGNSIIWNNDNFKDVYNICLLEDGL